MTARTGDEIFIGDPAASAFAPKATLNRWNGECFLTVAFDDSAIAQKNVELTPDNKVQWSTPPFDFKFYPANPDEDGLELEIILKTKPVQNSFVFSVLAPDLMFHHQPPLTEEFNKEDCEIWTETRVKTKDGQEFFRPEKIVGSYAVYHISKRHGVYETGKLFHIYRPQLTDASGKKAWGTINIADGQLTVTAPQEFLDSAVYPVVIDPTFGYTSAGGTAFSSINIITGSTFSLPENGDVTDIRIYMFTGASGLGVKCAIYDTSGNLKTTSAEINPDPDYVMAWQTCTVSPASSLSSGDFRLSAWTGIAGCYFYYDSGGTNQWGQKSQSYGAWPDPITWDSQAGRKLSIYATYTAGSTLQTVTDSLGLSDAFYRNKPSLAIPDSLGLVDLILRDKPSVDIDDSVSLAELVNVITQGLLKTVVDSVELSDAIKTLKTLSVADLIALSDVAGAPLRTVQITENVALMEVLQVGMSGVKRTKLFLLIGDVALQLTGD